MSLLDGWSACGGNSERVGADLTHTDGLAQVELEDGHLTGAALLAQQSATVTASSECERECECLCTALKVYYIYRIIAK